MPPRRPYIRKTAYLQSQLARLEEEVTRQKHELHERNLALLEMKAQIQAANQHSGDAPADALPTVGGQRLRFWHRLSIRLRKIPK